MLAKTILSVVPISIRTIRRFSAKELKGPLTFPQMRLLFLIRDGKGQSEIAEALQVSPAAISKMISQLVAKNFAERLPGKDRRSIGLKLTPQGKKVVDQVYSKLEARFDNNIKRLSKKEQSELQKGLIVLEKLMGFVNEE